jgi:hypothetical protein
MMPTIHVYRNGALIDSRDFTGSFHVFSELTGSQGLRWEADGEQSAGGGEYLLWIRRASTAPQIAVVRPDWKLVTDGTPWPEGAHLEVNVAGRKVELLHRDYRFVCSFPP